ncbi:MAG: hypothetical protein FWB96_07000 [Defluviitaleaceae bacterium]|nr:hypothetical protein [Defluviitaleaceae bacterium]MCL2262984.1 hypothetical protein [Defluviitaleaceae bacterium]
MREFMFLIVELMAIAVLQMIIGNILDEVSQKRTIKLINVACILISYFLLLRYVYNHFLGEITTMVNFYF